MAVWLFARCASILLVRSPTSWPSATCAVPGALVQIAVAHRARRGDGGTAMLWGWPRGAAIVFGLALSVASTVVLLRALEDRGLLDSLNGRIAVGWLVVEDLVVVLILVLLPALAGVLGGGGPVRPGRRPALEQRWRSPWPRWRRFSR